MAFTTQISIHVMLSNIVHGFVENSRKAAHSSPLKLQLNSLKNKSTQTYLSTAVEGTRCE